MRLAAVALVLVILVFWASAARADGLDVRVPDEVAAAPGELATVSLTLAPGDGRTISTDGPIRISLASETLTIPRSRLGRRHAADPDADAPRFELRMVAPTAGDHELTVAIRVWLCGPRTCRPVRETRTVKVRAALPTPSEPSSP